MAIHFISGKPGGGKSLYAVKLIVEELLQGTRPVFTNVALKIPELSSFLARHSNYESSLEHVRELSEGGAYVPSGVFRVRVLTDEETGEFWTYRPGGVRIGRLTKEDWHSGRLPDYSGVKDEGVLYVIDEVHNFFGARQWASTGQDVLFYLSQHRKLGDSVVCVTQAVGNVDKQFRSVAQDYTYLRNLAKERYGKFRLPNLFVRRTFSSPPTELSKPMETDTFRLDVEGLCSVYDSAAGVGIHGRSADTKERRKGYNILWWFAGIGVAVALLFAYIPRAVGHVFTKPLRGAVRVGVVRNFPAAPVASGGQKREDPWYGRQTDAVAVPVVPVTSSVSRSNEVWVTMWAAVHGRITIGLSDGRVYHWPGDRSVWAVGEDFVNIAGERVSRYHASVSSGTVDLVPRRSH